MIRILHVVGKMHYGGMETLIMNVYRNIDRSEVQFDFMVHYSEKGEYDDEIRELGGHIFIMPRTIPTNFVACKKAYSAFFKEHQEYKKVHVHLHNIAFLVFPEAHRYDIPCILHIHNNGVEKNIKGYLGLYCTKLAIPKADAVFSCSKEAALFFSAQKGINNLQIIKNGIETRKFLYDSEVRNRVREELSLNGKFVLLCVARFSIQKNHMFLLDIVNELKKRDVNVRLLLVGKGPLEKQLHHKIVDLHLSKEVIFLGARGDVNCLMQAADCYVMPSFWEGLGIVYVEAQAAGLDVYAASEAISKEVKITDLMHAISLNKSAAEWADIIYKNKDTLRVNQEDKIVSSGFDIRTSARYLQQFYQEQ